MNPRDTAYTIQRQLDSRQATPRWQKDESMTPEDVDNMQAGRELDMLVAEKVMGWQWRVWMTKPSGHPAYKTLCPPTDNNPWNYEGQPDPSGARLAASQQAPPRYSRDIAAAWQVVEKTDLFLAYTLRRWNGGYRVYRSVVDCTGSLTLDWCHPLAEADTAPLAICRAALKAISAQQPKGEGK